MNILHSANISEFLFNVKDKMVKEHVGLDFLAYCFHLLSSPFFVLGKDYVYEAPFAGVKTKGDSVASIVEKGIHLSVLVLSCIFYLCFPSIPFIL